ncbi:MAG: D-alanyl-D-alanine carboxypeptidase family protein [Novosphingobium sp.]
MGCTLSFRLKAALSVAVLLALPARAGEPAPAPPVEAAAIPVVMLTDLGSGQVLLARNPDRRFAPASITKVMTVYTAFGLIRRGDLDLRRSVEVEPATAREWNGKGTSLYLEGGQRVPVELLLRAITTVSANDASVVLASSSAGSVPAWSDLMNANARALGMTGSRFATPNGWPDKGATYVTARDLTRLADALTGQYAVEYRRFFGQKQLTFNGRTQQNKDPAIGLVSGADGIKTGHTNEAGFNYLGSAERQGRRLVMVVGGARSEAERAAASRALLEWGFSAWRARPLFDLRSVVGSARVQNGNARHVALKPQRPVHAVFPGEANGPVLLRIVYRGPLVAPIAKGAQVAELEIRSGGLPPGRVPLVAAESVGEAGPLDRLINGLAGLFS